MSDRTNILLNTGRKIHLQEIHQEYTYAGMLAGYPTTESNARYLAELALSKSDGAPRYVVHPVEQPIEAILKRRREHPNHPMEEGKGFPARLPPIICSACFTSDEIKDQDKDGCGSQLWVVWFQDEFAFPIAPEALRGIQAIDWEAVAKNFWM